MNFFDSLGGSHTVTIKTRFTPALSFKIGGGGDAPPSSGGGIDFGALVRPKLSVDGLELAPYGEPEDWIVYVEGLVLLGLGLYLLRKHL